MDSFSRICLVCAKKLPTAVRLSYLQDDRSVGSGPGVGVVYEYLHLSLSVEVFCIFCCTAVPFC